MEKATKIFDQLGNRLNSPEFKDCYRMNKKNFTRNRVLGFVTVVTTILNNISKSLNVEITKFLQQFSGGSFATKQAFSKARYKIKAEAFEDLNSVLVKSFYELGGINLLSGKFIVLAVDGSNYELPWDEDLVEEFGVADNKVGKQPKCMGTGVKIWDGLNHINVSAVLDRYDIAENQLFKRAWQTAREVLACRTEGRLLLLADMHYPAFWLMLDLLSHKEDFLFRCSPNFCREVTEFIQSEAKEALLNIELKNDPNRRSLLKKQGIESYPASFQVRAVRVDLPKGQPMCLLTSVSTEELSAQEISDLYPQRWGVEVSLFFDKHKMEVENFSAEKPQGIHQEWQAALLCANMTQLLIEDAQEKLENQKHSKPRKYEYQINRSAAIGLVKDELPKLLLGHETAKDFHARMVKLILRFKEPIRPGRTFPKWKKHKLKFSKNLRRVV